MGDINEDGAVNIIDALMLAQYYVGVCQCNPDPVADDVDGNGTLNIVDALIIAQYYVGIIDEFPANQGVSGMELVQSGLPRDLDPQPDPAELTAVAVGNNSFAFDLYGQLKEEPGNLFFSPVSITFAFAMCYAGANGTTESQIADVLHYTLPEPQLHNAMNSLNLTLTTPPANPIEFLGEDLQLNIVNAAWGQKDYVFQNSFLDTLALYYGSGLYTVDFIGDTENSRLTINDWVSDNTEQRIEDLLPLGSINIMTRLVLTNAIYFKATWADAFDEDDTTDGTFHQIDGSTVMVPMMHKQGTAAYAEVPGEYQMVMKDYEGTRKNCMAIIMPAEGQFENFENSLTADKFDNMFQSATDHYVTLTMPKFSYEWDKSLKDPLFDLGMIAPFIDGQADFSGINGAYDLVIQDVLHKSFVSVDEMGTEAAAATAIVLGFSSLPPAATMTIDRPFIYAIYNIDTGTILFLGRVVQI
jgi:serpin B